MPATQLVRITAPHFRGTVEFDVASGRVESIGDVLDYCVNKGWRYEAVPVVKGG